MNTFEEQLKSAIKEIRPSDAERAALRTKLVSEMAQTSLLTASRGMYSNTYTMKFNKWKRTIPAIGIIALLMSGTVSYAAEGSAPGDTLYPVKIHVNENVRGVLAVSDVAKAKLEVDLAEERLKEAEKLRSESRLDATTTVVLKNEFESHRSRARGHIDALTLVDATGTIRLREDFESRLGRHGEHDTTLSEFGIEIEDEGENRHDGDDNDEHDSFRATTSVSASTSLRVRGEDDSRHKSGDDSDNEDERVQSAAAGSLEIRTESTSRGRDHEEDDGDDEDDDHRGGLIQTITAPIVNPITQPTPTSGNASATFTLAQIASHNSASSCYSAISGKVYDLTPFIGGHPGGSAALLSLCGHDGTAGFMAQHGGASRPQNELASLYIGTLVQ